MTKEEKEKKKEDVEMEASRERTGAELKGFS